jgi:hypothetical protein
MEQRMYDINSDFFIPTFLYKYQERVTDNISGILDAMFIYSKFASIFVI